MTLVGMDLNEHVEISTDSENSTEGKISTVSLLIMKDKIRIGLPRSVEEVFSVSNLSSF